MNNTPTAVRVRLSARSLLNLALGEGNDPMLSWASEGPLEREVAVAAASVQRLADGAKILRLSPAAARLLYDELREAGNGLDAQLEIRGCVRGPDRRLWRADRDAMHRDADRVLEALEG